MKKKLFAILVVGFIYLSLLIGGIGVYQNQIVSSKPSQVNNRLVTVTLGTNTPNTCSAPLVKQKINISQGATALDATKKGLTSDDGHLAIVYTGEGANAFVTGGRCGTSD